MMNWIKAAFSEKGQPSSSRLLMAVFSVFTMAVIWKILGHLLKLSAGGNAAMLAVWLTNLPLIISSLCLLVALPYTVSRGTSAISDIAQFVANLKRKNE
jgi:hypothetical protein